MDTNVVRFADREWLEKMVDKDWPSPCHFGQAFVCGLVILFLLSGVVYLILDWLRRRGGVRRTEIENDYDIVLWRFALIEQFIFFLAAIAGAQVFGFAVQAWAVLKAIS